MTIAQSTTMQAYQLNKGGSRARMAILRMIAADSVRNANASTRLQPGDWKGARHYTLSNWESAYITLDRGMQGKTPIYYTHAGEQFRNERDACDIVCRLPSGWFTDTDCSETAIGIVGNLTHGRFIAGYRWTANDERVYYPEVFTDENEAARAADGHAEHFAEMSREDSERFHAMTDAEHNEECAADDVAMAYSARNSGPKYRQRCIDRIEELRAARADLAAATAAYERG